MSTRIEECFEDLRSRGEAALIAYFTAGDPDMDLVPKMITALDESGVDMVEVGVPFSDPMADGPTIQAASERALKNPVRMEDILKGIEKAREKTSVPIILFGYFNPIFRYGAEKLVKDARSAGVDGLLVVDLPPEEAQEVKVYSDREDLDFIFLVAPNTTERRLKAISKLGRGFIYCVSVTGVTGARKKVEGYMKDYIDRVRKHVDLPVAVGFGISTPEQAANVASFADGAVVGSAIINEMVNNPKNPIRAMAKFTKSLKQAMKKGAKKG